MASSSRLVFFALVVFAGCSSQREEPSPQTRKIVQEIQNGDEDTTHRFSVGVCLGTPGNCTEICSGTLITPNLVVTARHCVSKSDEKVDCRTNPTFGADLAGPFVVTTNDRMSNPGPAGWYSVASIARPTDNHLCGNDIALITLATSVPDSDAKPVVPGVQYLMWDPAAKYNATKFTAVGHGSDSPQGTNVGIRRNLTDIPILCIPGSPDLPCPQDQLTTDAEFYGGDGICQGDSGGGAYETTSFGSANTVELGVLSRGGDATDTNDCSQSVYTRLDFHRDFVLTTAKAASNNWTLYPEPSWTVEKPKPAGGTTDGGVTQNVSHNVGETCVSDTDCVTGLCADPKTSGRICSAQCAKDGDCSDGLVCRVITEGDKQKLCLKAGKPVAAAAKDEDGCATSPDPASNGVSAVLFAGITAFFVRRRRNSRQREA